MKIDIDSILYIVITIALLVISGLGSRRKKKLRQMGESSTTGAAGNPDSPKDMDAASVQQEPINPFDRLEQFLTGQPPPKLEKMEAESLETIVDEEELILEEIQKSNQEKQTEVPVYTSKDDDPLPEGPEIRVLPGFFENNNEIRKAVIYSEILKRKY
ncbi:hypothetical protein ACFLR8_03210 [Bacteroidota bacterium]